MADNQYYDIKPKSWDGAVLFNDLINVRPVPAPRTWMWTRKQDIVQHSDNGYYFFRKRKGIKFVRTYYQDDWCSEFVEDTTYDKWWWEWYDWRDWEFTDMVIFEWHRYFMRINKEQTKMRIYKQVWINTDKYWKQAHNDVSEWHIVCLKNQEFNTTPTTYHRFLKTQFIWWNIDWDSWDLIITKSLREEWEDEKVPFISYIIKVKSVVLTKKPNFVYFMEKWFTSEVWDEVCDSVFQYIWVTKEDWYSYFFLKSTDILSNFSLIDSTNCSWFMKNYEEDYENKLYTDLSLVFSDDYWDSLSYITSDGIRTIAWWYSEYRDKDHNSAYCEDFLTVPYEQFWSEIISACMWNNRIALLTDKGWLAVSWPWYSQFSFPADDANDIVTWWYNVWDRFTTIIPSDYSVILAWPHDIAHFFKWTQYAEQWLYTMSDTVWIFSETSFFSKDWKVFMWRSYWDVYYLELQSNTYWLSWWNFNYYSADRWTRLKDLVQWHQMMNIDMTDNDMFVSIYEEDEKYWSIVLCEDRHYNIRYTWMFEWLKISRVLEWWKILLWNHIYKMDEDYLYDTELTTKKTETDHVIKEVINIIFWDETPTANKHFMYYKMAIWDNSRITNDTWISTDVSSSWRLWNRCVHLTNTRYASLLSSKNSEWAVRKWDFWYEILWHWKRHRSWFDEELNHYLNLEKDTKFNARVWYTTSSEMALYSTIKESIWQEWELLQITLASYWTDDLEVWSVFIWRFAKDYDFADIEDVNVDSTEFTSDSESEWHIQKEFNTH